MIFEMALACIINPDLRHEIALAAQREMRLSVGASLPTPRTSRPLAIFASALSGRNPPGTHLCGTYFATASFTWIFNGVESTLGQQRILRPCYDIALC